MTLTVGSAIVAREKRNQYWQMLRRANTDFLKQELTGDAGVFAYYLKQTYGIEIELIDSKITSNYIVRDEKKYIMFLLKYGS